MTKQERQAECCRRFRANHPGYDSQWAKNNGYAAQKSWKMRNKHKINSYTRKRQALIKTTEVQFVSYEKVIVDSGGVCGICKQPLDTDEIEIDHIIPLAKGGAHTYENVQATHPFCNRRKGAKMDVHEIGRR